MYQVSRLGPEEHGLERTGSWVACICGLNIYACTVRANLKKVLFQCALAEKGRSKHEPGILTAKDGGEPDIIWNNRPTGSWPNILHKEHTQPLRSYSLDATGTWDWLKDTIPTKFWLSYLIFMVKNLKNLMLRSIIGYSTCNQICNMVTQPVDCTMPTYIVGTWGIGKSTLRSQDLQAIS